MLAFSGDGGYGVKDNDHCTWYVSYLIFTWSFPERCVGVCQPSRNAGQNATECSLSLNLQMAR